MLRKQKTLGDDDGSRGDVEKPKAVTTLIGVVMGAEEGRVS